MLNLKFFIVIFGIISFTLSAQNKIETFFYKVQNKKIEKLKENIKDLDQKTQKKIIKIIEKHDRKIFELRKKAIRTYKNKLGCEDRLINMEEHLTIRKKILEQQLKKLNELKALNLDCQRLMKIINFERRFMLKLRKRMQKYHKKGKKRHKPMFGNP